jgi:hypothetical protein
MRVHRYSATRVVMAAAVTVTAGLTACEKPTAVASSVSPCFRVLPIAHAALGNQGSRTPVDVARARGSAIPKLPFRRRTRPTTTTIAGVPTSVPRQRDVCLIAYRGPFDPNRISTLNGPLRAGRYAVVVVSVRTQRVVSVFLTDRLPAPLHGH